MSIINDSNKLGSGEQNLVLETAGRVYIKVADRFYELNFRDQGKKETTIINNPVEKAPEVDLSQYVTKTYLKSSLNNYVTQRGWDDVKKTQKMLEAALLEGYTETINPITINTMQMIVGNENLQFDFIESRNNTSPTSAKFTLEEGDQIVCPDTWIKHYTLHGPESVKPDTGYQYYARWNIKNPSDGSNGNTYLIMGDEGASYYIYIKVPEYSATITDSYVESHLANDPRGSLTGEFILSTEAHSLREEGGYLYLLAAIVTDKENGNRSISYMNGFTEILPGQITAYIFKSYDGKQYIDFQSKSFNIGDDPTLPDADAYVHYDQNLGLLIKGAITVTGGELKDTLENLQAQIDDEVQA